jgi:rRNA maturation RNase YbeY
MTRASPCRARVHGAESLPGTVVDAAVASVLTGEHRRAAISVTFLGPRRMRQLNARHFGHDLVTDVISFTLPQRDASVLGDIYVCRYLAARHARERGRPVREELVRVVVHGVLHVLGYDHGVGATRTTGAMWRRQERYVAMSSCPS